MAAVSRGARPGPQLRTSCAEPGLQKPGRRRTVKFRRSHSSRRGRASSAAIASGNVVCPLSNAATAAQNEVAVGVAVRGKDGGLAVLGVAEDRSVRLKADADLYRTELSRGQKVQLDLPLGLADEGDLNRRVAAVLVYLRETLRAS